MVNYQFLWSTSKNHSKLQYQYSSGVHLFYLQKTQHEAQTQKDLPDGHFAPNNTATSNQCETNMTWNHFGVAILNGINDSPWKPHLTPCTTVLNMFKRNISGGIPTLVIDDSSESAPSFPFALDLHLQYSRQPASRFSCIQSAQSKTRLAASTPIGNDSIITRYGETSSASYNSYKPAWSLLFIIVYDLCY